MQPSPNETSLPTAGPYKEYATRLGNGVIQEDSNQKLAALRLQQVFEDIQQYNQVKKQSWANRIFSFKPSPVVPKGIYIHGGVGRGKSMLMDIFFDALPTKKKKRVHFHAFMQTIHSYLHTARQSDLHDPLSQVLDDFSSDLNVLCLDEIQITDITDAMLVGRVFEGLYERKVVIIITSNRTPESLYKDGLNRHLFMPFIALIRTRMDIYRLDGPLDYRLRSTDNVQVYLTPICERTTQSMDDLWEEITGHAGGEERTIEVQGHGMTLPCCHEDCTRTTFKHLCDTPLGAADYLALVGVFRTIMLDDIPYLSRDSANAAKRFVTLIDTIYENRRVLICSAECQPENLYESGVGAFEFQRTASRLHEMRSAQYLSNASIF